MPKITGIQTIERLKKLDRMIEKVKKSATTNLQIFEDEKDKVVVNILKDIDEYVSLISLRSEIELVQENLNTRVNISYQYEKGEEREFSLALGIKQLSIYDRTLSVLKVISAGDISEISTAPLNRYMPRATFKTVDPTIVTIPLVNTYDPKAITKMVEDIEDAKSSLKTAISHGNNVPIEFSEETFNTLFKDA